MHSLRSLPILVEWSEEIMNLYHGPSSKLKGLKSLQLGCILGPYAICPVP